jgi:DNA-binding transcriptional ArsR family regulator
MRKVTVNKVSLNPLTPTLTAGRIRNLQETLLKNGNFEKERNLAEVVSGETRLKILYLLAREGYLSVSDIAAILRSKNSGVSHQLAVLRENNLVKTRKRQRVVFYSLKTPLPKLIWSAVDLR